MGPYHQGLHFFSRTQFQYRFAVRFLQILQLLLVLLANILRIGAKGVLHPLLRILDPLTCRLF